MSAFHHKGELVEYSKALARYRFFPNAYDKVPKEGEFEVCLSSWKVEVIRLSGEGTDKDQHSTLALVHKLKKHLEDHDQPPETIWFIG